MVQPARRRATYQDVLDAPEHQVAEIIDGELHLSPRPGGPHCSVTTTLAEELGSPFKRGRDRAKKLRIYAAHGVRHARLISPSRRTLEVFRLHDGMWLNVAVHHDDAKVRVEPFEAIELDLSVLWADLPPPPADRASESTVEYGETQPSGW